DGRLVVRKRDRRAIVLDGQSRNVRWRDGLRAHLVGARLRNVPVLAKEAAHIASGRAQAEDARAGQEMIQRFFFNGIDLQRSGRAVAQAVQPAAFVHADKAKAGLAGAYSAVARAQEAVNTAIRFRFPPQRFMQRFGLLEDLELVHTILALLPQYSPRWESLRH